MEAGALPPDPRACGQLRRILFSKDARKRSIRRNELYCMHLLKENSAGPAAGPGVRGQSPARTPPSAQSPCPYPAICAESPPVPRHLRRVPARTPPSARSPCPYPGICAESLPVPAICAESPPVPRHLRRAPARTPPSAQSPRPPRHLRRVPARTPPSAQSPAQGASSHVAMAEEGSDAKASNGRNSSGAGLQKCPSDRLLSVGPTAGATQWRNDRRRQLWTSSYAGQGKGSNARTEIVPASHPCCRRARGGRFIRSVRFGARRRSPPIVKTVRSEPSRHGRQPSALQWDGGRAGTAAAVAARPGSSERAVR